MKISQNGVRIASTRGTPALNANLRKVVAPKINTQKPMSARPFSLNVSGQVRKLAQPAPSVPSSLRDEYYNLKEAALAVQRMRFSAQQELESIRKMRADAVKYQQETAMKARSGAHQLVLHSRLETQREIEELIRRANEEIQKILADIRVIRITAQEELAAQRKFTDAAKISSMSLSIKKALAKPEGKKKK